MPAKPTHEPISEPANPDALPPGGGSYTRLPDGTLAPNNAPDANFPPPQFDISTD